MMKKLNRDILIVYSLLVIGAIIMFASICKIINECLNNF